MKSAAAVGVLVVGLLIASRGYGWVLVAAVGLALVMARGAGAVAPRTVRYHVHATGDTRKAATAGLAST